MTAVDENQTGDALPTGEALPEAKTSKAKPKPAKEAPAPAADPDVEKTVAAVLESVVNSPLYQAIRLQALSPLLRMEAQWSFLPPKLASLCIAMREHCGNDLDMANERTRLAVAALPALIHTSVDDTDRWNRIAHRAVSVADLCLK